jgi:hypothetical protein
MYFWWIFLSVLMWPRFAVYTYGSLPNPDGSHCKSYLLVALHCNENPIYVFPEMELRGLSPNYLLHVSVSNLYIPRIGPHIFLQQNRQTDSGNI